MDAIGVPEDERTFFGGIFLLFCAYLWWITFLYAFS